MSVTTTTTTASMERATRQIRDMVLAEYEAQHIPPGDRATAPPGVLRELRHRLTATKPRYEETLLMLRILSDLLRGYDAGYTIWVVPT
jgi:hypothetical protein